MAYTTLPNSGLRKPTGYGESDLLAIDTYNWQRMANTLLKFTALLDTNTAGLSNGDVLKYDSATQKWVVATPDRPAISTTTTTTTTTSTTTTTTTV